MEPVTTTGLAITAYLAKDGIAKLLGPTAEYLGEGLKDLTRRRVESIGKMDNSRTPPGSVVRMPPEVRWDVMNEASYSEDC